tara:strand:+ start:1390 stop:1722 length:333 start_codon:yes stop_codon:yes gene_type:complete
MTTTHAPQCTALELSQGYSGWKNRETWAVNLWFTNEPYGDEKIMEIATSGMDLYAQSEAYRELADEFVFGFNEECEQALTTGLAADLLSGALADVDFFEIAKNHPASDFE